MPTRSSFVGLDGQHYTVTSGAPPPPSPASRVWALVQRDHFGGASASGLAGEAAAGAVQAAAGLGSVAGAVGLGVAALLACLAAGPLGWLAAFVVVPAAVAIGAAGGAVIGLLLLGGLGLLILAAIVRGLGLH